MEDPSPSPGKRGFWRRLWVGYGLLLLASYLVWGWRALGGEDEPREPHRWVSLVDRGEPVEGRALVAFRESAGRDLPVVLLHGSPGHGGSFGPLVRELPESWRVVAPDLPGFGASWADLPDYSIESHARYVLLLLDELGIESAHVVGFSMGGGVALHMASEAPERVRSVTLLSAIGVQELEMFGSYELNHLVHGLQLAALGAARWLLPHFGRFDRNPLNVAYARNFYDTDQRPLRRILESYPGPLLIQHGKQDFLVPFAAAREHHRIVPQSELEPWEEGHFLLWQKPAELAASLVDFVDRVEGGQAPLRSQAEAGRLQQAARPFDPSVVPPASGPTLLVLLVLIALATLVSEDLTCIAAGLLVADGRLGFLPASAACTVGIFLGDVGLYGLGRILGRPALGRAPLKWFVNEASVERASRWFSQRGGRVIFLSRFLPGLRLPTYVAVGVLRTRFLHFAFYFLLACLLWTPLLVALASWIGAEAKASLEIFQRNALLAFVLLLVGMVVLQRLALPAMTPMGRRLLVGRWRRKRHWEFWPPYVFYVPVVFYVAWLAFKHRSLALVTAVNPAIPTGGFVGESKSAILEGLGGDECVARHVKLEAGRSPEERLQDVERFLDRHRLPLVSKPDVGERGSGVVIHRDAQSLRERVRAAPFDLIVQEYAPGPEFGVFYWRKPGEASGRVFSITRKELPVVVGDGVRTLEKLVLDDERAVCLFSVYQEANLERWLDVPAAGEEVQLVQLGTHARGAIFLDGRPLLTDELEATIERISRGFEGFYFGRYDLRAPSVSDLQAGRGLRVIELNGLTSEATHIYDRKTPLFEAYRTLFEQWRTAFEIARANRDRGVRPSTLGELVREVRKLPGQKALRSGG